ncbi:MAG: hypothetical protein RSA02_04355 [Bacteroidales bacterium]
MIETKNIKKETFFKKIGITSSNFRGEACNTPLNSTTIANIIAEIPDVNPEWLLTGSGEMLRNSSVGIIQNGNKNKIEKSPVTLISTDNKENEDLREKIKYLEELLTAKNEIINLLKNKQS